MDVKTTRLSALVVVVCTILFCASGCTKFNEIKVTGGKISSVSMVGLKSIELNCVIEIDNPTGKLDVLVAEGDLKYFGKVLGKVTLDPVVVEARSCKEYPVVAKIAMAEGVRYRDLLELVNISKLYECTMDLHLKGKASGFPAQLSYKDVPLKKLLEL